MKQTKAKPKAKATAKAKSKQSVAATEGTNNANNNNATNGLRLVKVFPNGRCILVNTIVSSATATTNSVLLDNEIYSIQILSPTLQLQQFPNQSIQLALFACDYHKVNPTDSDVIRVFMPYPFNQKIWYQSILFGLFDSGTRTIVSLLIGTFQNIVTTTWGNIVKPSSLKKAATVNTLMTLSNKTKKNKTNKSNKTNKKAASSSMMDEDNSITSGAALLSISTTPTTSTHEKGIPNDNDVTNDDTTTSASVSSSEGDLDEFDDIDEYVTVFDEDED